MISFVLCFYKNHHNVDEVYKSILEYVNSEKDYEIIFVNDNAPDQTWLNIKEIAKKNINVKAICFTKNYGQHNAMEAGLKLASGDKILYFDSDRILDCKFLKKADDLCDENNPLIWGEQKIKSSFIRNIFLRIYSLFLIKKYNYRSVFLIHKSVKEKIFKYFNHKEKIIGEILNDIEENASRIKCDFKNLDNKTRYNFSKLSLHAIKHILNDSKYFYLNFMMINIILGAAVIFVSIFLFILKFFKIINYLDGWVSTILLISFFGSLILIITSLIGITLLQILNQVENKPNYFVAETKNINYKIN